MSQQCCTMFGSDNDLKKRRKEAQKEDVFVLETQVFVVRTYLRLYSYQISNLRKTLRGKKILCHVSKEACNIVKMHEKRYKDAGEQV